MDRSRVVERVGGDMVGEGPLWSDRLGMLFWVDILGQAVNRLDPSSGAVTRWDVPERIGWLIERSDHEGFVAGLKSGFAFLALQPLTITPIGNPEPARPDNRMNDAKADRHGAIWAGTKDDNDRVPSGALYRLAPDCSWSLQDDGYQVTNGPAFSPDGRIMYHADSGRRLIYAFDASDEGHISGRRVHIAFEDEWGYPDGMTVDAEGGLWVAHWGGGRISRFDPDGSMERCVPLPAKNVTSATFAGPQLDRLFVTSARLGDDHTLEAGALFEVECGIVGLPPHRFGG